LVGELAVATGAGSRLLLKYGSEKALGKTRFSREKKLKMLL